MKYDRNKQEELKIAIDHTKEEVFLYPKSSSIKDKYQLLGKKPDLESKDNLENYSNFNQRQYGPSELEDFGAQVVASSITTSFVVAESILETGFNSLKTLSKVLD